ncbi:hypothetical protein ACTFIW_006365 [Dictyostelium discoideum]
MIDHSSTNNTTNNNNNNNNNIRIHNELKDGKLLNEKGELNECGISTKVIKEYDRNSIKVKNYRIKEWDYYFITNSRIGIALTFGDIGYIGSAGVTLFNFDEPSYKTQSDLSLCPFGKFNFPNYPHTIQKLEYNSSKIKLSFENIDNSNENENENENEIIKHLKCNSKNFDGKGNELIIDIKLTNLPKHSMVIATPFDNYPNSFYYNCKTNNMVAQGTIKLNDKTHLFNPENSLAVLDWGRGVWPMLELITWYWGSLSCRLDDNDNNNDNYFNNKTFGFNIGYGFGNTSAATENMIFLDGIAHKFDEIKFEIPKKLDTNEEDYMSDWKFTSNDKRLEMTFKPIINRYENTNLLLIKTTTNQVFGNFSGTAILDDGTLINFKNKLGFAEKVCNKW